MNNTTITKLNRLELLLIEKVKKTGLMEPKIYMRNQGVDKNSFYVLNILENPKKSTKKYANLLNKTKVVYRELKDLYQYELISESYIEKSVEYLSNTILKSQGVNSIYRRILIKKWNLNKETEFFKLYSLDKYKFFKYIMPMFWKFMSKNQLKFFINKLKKEKLETSYYFYKTYAFKSKNSNQLNNFVLNNLSKIELNRYYEILLTHNYKYLYNFRDIKDYLLRKDTDYADRLMVLTICIKNNKMKAKDKKFIINFYKEESVLTDILDHPSINKMV